MKAKRGRRPVVLGKEKVVFEKPARKTRSDKKRDLKPTVSIEIKDSIYRLSYIMTTPVKDVCEIFVKHAVYGNDEIIDRLSKNFQRGIHFKSIFFNGSLGNRKISKKEMGESDRISFRITNELYSQLHALAYALDCSVSRVAAILLYETLTDYKFIERYTNEYVNSLDDLRKKELKALLNFLKVETGESFSTTGLLSYLADNSLKWFMPND